MAVHDHLRRTTLALGLALVDPEVLLYEYGPIRTARGGPTPCEGMTSRRVPDHDRTIVTVPWACVGSPAWIRTGALTTRYTGKAVRSDDARRDGAAAAQMQLGAELGYN